MREPKAIYQPPPLVHRLQSLLNVMLSARQDDSLMCIWAIDVETLREAIKALKKESS